MTEFKPEFFAREDESADADFYREARLVVHIDDAAIEDARQLYAELLPVDGAILDLMSSYRSHLPDGVSFGRVVGLGMNGEEMAANPQLTEYLVHDLNADARLPFSDAEFDAAVITVSVQYLIGPVETLAEVARVLRHGAPCIITYSNRMFPTKAVRIWRSLADEDRARLIALYFERADGFDDITFRDCTSPSAGYRDPLYAVWARRLDGRTAGAAPSADPV